VQALRQYLAAIETGRKPDRQEFQSQFPEIAETLAQCLDGLEFVHTAAPHLNDLAQSPTATLPHLDSPPLRTLGDFRILREIGRGGMGVVYEAEQISLGRRVALKVLPFAATFDPKHLQRFHNEAAAAAHLHHTNIVPVFAVGSERGVHFYAMQFIEGQTLAALIHGLRLSAENKARNQRAQGSVTAPVYPSTGTDAKKLQSMNYFRMVAKLGAQAAEGLEHAHQMGIVHRDIKPANLLVDVRGNLWITDFGLARLQSEAGPTMTGDLVGTLRYMSPEQALAIRGQVDHRTDIYSLGVTLYELLTLKPAFSGSDRQELLQQIAFEEPRPPRQLHPAVPADLEMILLKAMAKEADDRYVTAQELADDLERFLQDKPIRAKRPSLLQRTTRWARRHRNVVASAVLLLVLSVVGLAICTVFIWREKEQTKLAFRQADGQRMVAQRHLEEANIQRGRAEQNFRKAQGAVTQLLMLFEEKRWEQRNDRIHEMRQAMAEEILRFFKGSLDEANSDVGVRMEQGLAHMLLANVHRIKRKLEKSQESYKKAIDLFEQLVVESPDIPVYRQELALAHMNLGLALDDAGRPEDAACHYKIAVEHFRQCIKGPYPDIRPLNNYAWFLVTCPQTSFRDPVHAVALAEKAVHYPCGLEVPCAFCWNTLGVALYRAGDYKGAIQALGRSMELHNGGDSIDWFFLAMAHWHLGDKKEARKWYDKALGGINPYAEDLSRFQTEAAALLGVKTAPPQTKLLLLPVIP
jgi:serine/threonine protein kinase/Tfp pilus assembly protein PilF